MASLTIDIQELASRPGAAVVALVGPIDAQSVIALRAEINSAQDRGLGHLILDMEKVTYVNSTGMGLLITLSDAAGSEGLPLVKVSPKVRVILDMMNIGSLFRMFQSREEALGAFLGKAAILTTPAQRSETLVAALERAPDKSAPVSSLPTKAFAAEVLTPAMAASPPAPLVPVSESRVPRPMTSKDAPPIPRWSLTRVLLWAAVAGVLAFFAWFLTGGWGR